MLAWKGLELYAHMTHFLSKNDFARSRMRPRRTTGDWVLGKIEIVWYLEGQIVKQKSLDSVGLAK